MLIFYFMGKHFEKDVWRALTFCSGKYKVSRFGKVMSAYSLSKHGLFKPTGTVLKTNISYRGYEYVSLHWLRDGVSVDKKISVHRLVAMAFIPNPDNKPEVNHKDLNKLNNDYRNLEWCTPKENMAHAQRMGATPTAKPYIKKGRPDGHKIVIDINTGVFYNTGELASLLGINVRTLTRTISEERYRNTTQYRYCDNVEIIESSRNLPERLPKKPVSPKTKKIRPPKKEYVPHPLILKRIGQYTAEGVFLKEFMSVKEAAESVSSNAKTFRRAIKHSPLNFSKGFIWKYV